MYIKVIKFNSPSKLLLSPGMCHRIQCRVLQKVENPDLYGVVLVKYSDALVHLSILYSSD